MNIKVINLTFTKDEVIKVKQQKYFFEIYSLAIESEARGKKCSLESKVFTRSMFLLASEALRGKKTTAYMVMMSYKASSRSTCDPRQPRAMCFPRPCQCVLFDNDEDFL